MPYIALEKLTDKSENSVYKLVVLAAKRSLELAEGKPKLIENGKNYKFSTIALYEIAAGKIKFKKVKGDN